MRSLALTMKDPETVILMTDLAADYDKLAERAAIRANEKKAAIEWQVALGRCRNRPLARVASRSAR
jgi:hypothetical protein